MIIFNRLWGELKKQGKTKIFLRGFLGGSTYNSLRHNKPVSTYTIDLICKKLNCQPESILEYIPDEEYNKDN